MSAAQSQTVNVEFLPSPTSTFGLWEDLTYADANPGSYAITLSLSDSYVLDDTTGPLPQIAAGVTLTIDGGGAVIARSSAAAAFRLFNVASGGSLTLKNLTLTGGLAAGAGTAAEGGAIYNSGALTLSSVMVKSNMARGSDGAPGTGVTNGTNGA